MAVLNDVRIGVVENNIAYAKGNRSREKSGLTAINLREGGNDKQIRQVLEHYPVILEKIKNEE